MSIKIIITSPASLTKREIDDLRDYLLIAASGAMAEATVTEPNDLLPTLEDVTKEPPKSRKKRTTKEPVESIAPPPSPLTSGANAKVSAWSVGNSDQEALMTADRVAIWNAGDSHIAPVEEIGRGERSKHYQVMVEDNLTHEELVAWVLENVREMRLNFDNVLEVVTSFGIPTLSLIGLKEHPELIMPAYDKFKNLVDN